MTRTTIERIACDRCGDDTGTDSGFRDIGRWSRIFAATAGDPIVGTHEMPADLCPSCTFELNRWMAGARLSAPEPAEPEAAE